MRYRMIGEATGSSRRVSALALGAMRFGTATDEPTAFAILDRFLAAGGNFIDTANNYAWWDDGGRGGQSEQLLGRWRTSRDLTDEVVIATKVGFFTVATGIEVMFAERWTGVSWSVQHPPYPAGATGVQLAGVSCAQARVCTAVGFFTNGSGLDGMLAERWDGSRWSIEPLPAPARTTSNSLADISCNSTTACMAVGESIDAAGTGVTLAERRT
jgi:hypothetical protein